MKVQETSLKKAEIVFGDLTAGTPYSTVKLDML